MGFERASVGKGGIEVLRATMELSIFAGETIGPEPLEPAIPLLQAHFGRCSLMSAWVDWRAQLAGMYGW
jgi:hypothetical protein